MDFNASTNSTLSDPSTVTSPENNISGYEDAGFKTRKDENSSSDKVTPETQSHGTPTSSGTGRHTRRNNTGPLKSLHVWEAGGFTSNQTINATPKEKASLNRRD